MFGYVPGLTNQLIQTLFVYDAIAMDIDVHAVILLWGSSIQSHAKMDWLAICARTHHQMKISRIEAKRDDPGRLVEHPVFIVYGPGFRRLDLRLIGSGLNTGCLNLTVPRRR